MKASFIIVTRNRKDDLAEALASILRQRYVPIDVIVVDNASTDGTSEVFGRGEFGNSAIRYVRLEENRGVSGGRNAAIQQAQGTVIIALDDDAVLRDQDATGRVVDFFRSNPDVGILASKVVNYYTGKLQVNAFPCRAKSANPDIQFETTWFIGAGHAIRREVFDKIGLYRDFFPWGSEELDLSFRALDAGYRIMYFPQLVVYHKQSPAARIEDRTIFEAIALKHRIKAAILNLPWRYVLTYSIVWSTAHLALKSRLGATGSPRVVLLAYYYLFKEMSALRIARQPILKETLQKIARLNGPLFY